MCRHAGECGGCKYQHIEYSDQLKEKQIYIESLFQPNHVDAIVASDDIWRYRGKMEFTFSQDKCGNRFLGLFICNGRGKVLDLCECLIADQFVETILDRVRKWWISTNLLAYYPPLDRGSLQTLTVRSGTNQMVILTLSGNCKFALTSDELDSFVKAVQVDATTSVYIIIKCISKGVESKFYEMHLGGPQYLELKLCDIIFNISPQVFFQPNLKVAEKMLYKAIDILELKGDEKVLDLYCGVGTIGIILSNRVLQVIGIEWNANSICDAKENIEKNRIENMQVYQGDVKDRLNNIMQFFTPDIVILDPPRIGLDVATKNFINQIHPKKILYISCNPKSQEDDIKSLVEYKIDIIAPFDQFPHTQHIENIILLTTK